ADRAAAVAVALPGLHPARPGRRLHRRPGRARRRPGSGDPPVGLPVRSLPDAGRWLRHELVVTSGPGRAAPRRDVRVALAREVVPPDGAAGRHVLRGRGRRLRRPGTRRGLDRRRHRRGVHPSPPAGLGALGGDVAARGARGRAVRGRHRRAVRRRVDVPPGHRRLEGGAGGAGRPALRRVRRGPAARRSVAHPAPRLAGGGGGAESRLRPSPPRRPPGAVADPLAL
ncbi:MAG: Leucyl/phenylalanyl-tRNA--protein transferase, partial [uncultured Nocardioidaceae bacterium]